MSIPNAVIDGAEHRYRERATAREAIEARLRYQPPIRVDTQERVELRRQRLSKALSAEVVGAAVIGSQSDSAVTSYLCSRQE